MDTVKQNTVKQSITKTIEYYNQHSSDFVSSTIRADFSKTQDRFLDKLPSGSMILDFGCGSGRDTKYFLDKGYQVAASDGSIELCKSASEFTGIEVKHMLFEQLSDANRYDGIWACASILHLNKTELDDVFPKMIKALKENGIIYTSFKYGEFEGERNGRFFTDFTEKSFAEFAEKYKEIKMEECFVTGDVRMGRENEKWLNLILRKRNIYTVF